MLPLITPNIIKQESHTGFAFSLQSARGLCTPMIACGGGGTQVRRCRGTKGGGAKGGDVSLVVLQGFIISDDTRTILSQRQGANKRISKVFV